MDRQYRPAATATPLPRIAGLDLLRAAAILAVLVMHMANRIAAEQGWPIPVWSRSFGYFGVELFFVLSGFLIGRILIGIAATNPGPRDWAIFLTRRWMRTVPLYFAWLILLLVVTPPPEFISTAARYLTFRQNLLWPMPGGWFSVSWSLAVEEWFYLLFSTVLLGLSARRVRGALLWSCLLFVTVPLAIRIFLIAPDAPFDTGMRQIALARLDAIAFGVIIASAYINLRESLQQRRSMLFVVGCALLFVPTDLLALFGDDALFIAVRPYLFSLTSIGFALWIPAAMELHMTATRFYAVVRWLSDRSYCLYIIHLSIIDFAEWGAASLHLPALLCVPAALLMSAGIAELSFRYLETPILRLRPKQPIQTAQVETTGLRAASAA
jgi:peptidoglycan/LPS O-acetylase OafA/YrhL